MREKMERYRKKLILPASLAVLLVTAGVAFAGGFSSLKKDYMEYGGSEYLKENLSVEAPITVAPENQGEGLKELRAVKKELGGRKSIEAKALEESIIRNGLFMPGPFLWEKVKQVPKDETEIKGFERLLTDEYNLETVLAVALRNNQDIKRSLESARAALEKYDQVANLDEILNQYAVFTKNLKIRLGKPLHKRPLTLDFPFPGMLALKGNIVDKEVLIARLKLERTVQDVITRVRETYYEAVYLDNAVSVTKEVLELLRRTREVINTVYTTGKSSLNDVVKIQIEIDRVENELVETVEKKYSMQLKLNKLLDISEGFTPPVVPELTPLSLAYVEEELFREGEVTRNEIKMKLAKLDRMRLLIEMAEKRFYPDFTLGFSLFENRILKQVGTDAPEPAFPTRPMVRGANWFGSNDAFIRETRKKYRALEEEIEELKNSTVYEIDQALYRYENAGRLRTLFESRLVPKTKLTVEINETMYITGKVDFMDLIDSQQLYLNFSLSLKKSIKDMNVEAARLERLVGSAIKRRTGEDRP
jgi:hypothetical protein